MKKIGWIPLGIQVLGIDMVITREGSGKGDFWYSHVATDWG